MNRINRTKIEIFLRTVDDISPLKFGTHAVFNLDEHPIEDLIVYVLNFMHRYNSISSSTGEIETYRNHDRSIIDIWRHLKFYLPELSIFDVMKNIHKVKGLVGHYCPTVGRQVFNLKSIRKMYDFYNGSNEFDVPFSEWKEL